MLPSQELMAEEDPLTMEQIWETWDTMFESDRDRPSPMKKRARRVYVKFFPVKHQ